jgi:hypothetical protein
VSKSFGDLFDGVGTMLYQDGKVYEGHWKDGVRHGYGRLVHVNGSSYIGLWSADMANGAGRYQDQDGYKFEGHWKDDCQDGQGVETWSHNGSRFEGTFE